MVKATREPIIHKTESMVGGDGRVKKEKEIESGRGMKSDRRDF
jgi:hypothetical protein